MDSTSNLQTATRAQPFPAMTTTRQPQRPGRHRGALQLRRLTRSLEVLRNRSQICSTRCPALALAVLAITIWACHLAIPICLLTALPCLSSAWRSILRTLTRQTWMSQIDPFSIPSSTTSHTKPFYRQS